ncbi:hypothetical protein ACGFNV_46300 [Streptomyces sp. NPDC048751]|uniref:hypothetical protein n=1 Tax=Streptomyces sp. NPDC048751 TaxID=3365591 RepID=UPI00371DC2C8
MTPFQLLAMLLALSVALHVGSVAAFTAWRGGTQATKALLIGGGAAGSAGAVLRGRQRLPQLAKVHPSYLYDANGELLIRRAKGDGDTVLSRPRRPATTQSSRSPTAS